MKFKQNEQVEAFSNVTRKWHEATISEFEGIEDGQEIYRIKGVRGIDHLWYRCNEKRIRKLNRLEDDSHEL